MEGTPKHAEPPRWEGGNGALLVNAPHPAQAEGPAACQMAVPSRLWRADILWGWPLQPSARESAGVAVGIGNGELVGIPASAWSASRGRRRLRLHVVRRGRRCASTKLMMWVGKRALSALKRPHISKLGTSRGSCRSAPTSDPACRRGKFAAALLCFCHERSVCSAAPAMETHTAHGCPLTCRRPLVGRERWRGIFAANHT